MNSADLKKLAIKNKADILEPYGMLMDLEGFDSICAFSDYYGGSTIYVPKTNAIFRGCVDREALRDYRREGDFKALVRKYGMSESYWRKVVHSRG